MNFILVPKYNIKKIWTNTDFLHPLCSVFPYQVMKTVRLGLGLTEQILENPEVQNDIY